VGEREPFGKDTGMKIQKRKSKELCEPDRFVITDDNGIVVDDAQGWGYKSFEKASKAMWYRFGGGKEKMDKSENEKRDFFINHPGVEKYINKYYEWNFKEMARGETTIEDLIEGVKQEFGIDIPEKFLK